MEERMELPIPEKNAGRTFGNDETRCLSSGVPGKVLIRSEDPRVPEIVNLEREPRAQRDDWFGAAGLIPRYLIPRYSTAKWNAAGRLHAATISGLVRHAMNPSTDVEGAIVRF
jgi:hypothetical protein